MAESIESIVQRAVVAAEGVYHRLILLIGEPGSGKTRVFQKLGKAPGVKSLNLNLLLSLQILELTQKKRSLHLPKLLEQAIRIEDEIVLLDNIEILFDTSLKQDPLRLLQKISRNKTIISSWSGRQDGSRLLYAEPGHPEYRAYEITDFLTVNMDGQYNFQADTKLREANNP